MDLRNLNFFRSRHSPEQETQQRSSGLIAPIALARVIEVEKIPESNETVSKSWGRAALESFAVTVEDFNRKDKKRHTHYTVTSGLNLDDAVALDVPLGRGHPMMTKNTASTKARMLNSVRAGFPTINVSVSDQLLDLNAMGSHENAIIKEFASRLQLKQGEMLLNGESRHAAIIFAMARLAAKYDLSVLDVESDAPCFAEKSGYTPNILRTMHFVGEEAVTGAAMLVQEPCRTIGNIAMLFPRLDAAKNYTVDTHTLASGQAGNAARKMPHDINGRVVLFKRDRWSRPQEWADIFSAKEVDGEIETPLYPNIDIAIRPGSHATLGRYDEVHEHGQRLYELAERYKSGELKAA